MQGAGGGTTGVAQAYVADTVEPERPGPGAGLALVGHGGGRHPRARRSARSPPTWGHAAPGLVAAALCLINVPFAWRWLPESRPATARKAAAAPARSGTRPGSSVRHPGNLVSRLIWIYGIGMLAFSAMTSVLALYLRRSSG